MNPDDIQRPSRRPGRPRLFPSPPPNAGTTDRLEHLFWQGAASAVVVTTERIPPRGFRTIEAYSLVPSARRPRYLLPLLSRSAAAHSVRLYNSLRSPARRITRLIAGPLLQVGAVQPFLRDRLYVHVSMDVPDAELSKVSLIHHLAQLLHQERVGALVSFGGSGPYAKPVIQIVSMGGTCLGFVKVGWDEVTTRLVANEARALQMCARGRLRTLRVPQLLHSGKWNQLELSVASPLPEGVLRYPPHTLPPLEITEEICALTGSGDQPVWQGTFADILRERTQQTWSGGSASHPHPLPDLLRWLQVRFPEARLRIGAWHGDWVPWNMATLGHDVYAWDWEHSGEAVPLGFDVVHFFFQSAFIRDGMGLTEAIERSKLASAEPLRRLGISDPLTGLVRGLYFAEVAFRAEEVMRLGGEPNRRLYPRILDAFRRPHELVS